LRKIGRRRDADQRGDALRARQRREQHDPAAHAGAHQDLRALGQRVDHGHRVVAPAADRAGGEIAAGSAMPEIVEAQISAPVAAAIFVKEHGLGAGHVGAEAAEKDDAGRCAREPLVGNCGAIRPC
jgi:hypothetical protein